MIGSDAMFSSCLRACPSTTGVQILIGTWPVVISCEIGMGGPPERDCSVRDVSVTRVLAQHRFLERTKAFAPDSTSHAIRYQAHCMRHRVRRASSVQLEHPPRGRWR